MNVFKCYSRDQLREFMLGNLPDNLSDRIDEHLVECDICEDTVVGLDRSQDTLLVNLRKSKSDAGEIASASVQQGSASIGNDASSPAFEDPYFRRAFSKVVESAIQRPDDPQSVASAMETELHRIGDYEVIDTLAHGGMGSVFRARHTRLEKLVALKILPQRKMQNSDAINRFSREMKIIGQMSHPSMVAATDAGMVDGVHYLAMELIDGMDLGKVVRCAGRLSVADACEVVYQAALGLEYAHSKGVIHRDVKPSNLMLCQDGTIKVLDLGLATLSGLTGTVDELTTVGQLMGTLDYMAPEQCGNQHLVDEKSDVYALGATLYKLLTALAPYSNSENDTPLKKLKAMAISQPTPISENRDGLPSSLIVAISKALSRDPSQRYQSAKEFAGAIHEHAAGHELRTLLQSASRLYEERGSRLSSKLDVLAAGPTRVSTKDSAERKIVKASNESKPVKTKPKSNSINWFSGFFIAASMLAMLGGAIYGGIVIYLNTGNGQLVVESEVDDIKILVFQEDEAVADFQVEQGKGSTTLRAGKYRIEIQGESDNLVIENDRFTVRRGDVDVARVTRKPNKAKESTNSENNGIANVTKWFRLALSGRRLAAFNQSLGDPKVAKEMGVAVSFDKATNVIEVTGPEPKVDKAIATIEKISKISAGSSSSDRERRASTPRSSSRPSRRETKVDFFGDAERAIATLKKHYPDHEFTFSLSDNRITIKPQLQDEQVNALLEPLMVKPVEPQPKISGKTFEERVKQTALSNPGYNLEPLKRFRDKLPREELGLRIKNHLFVGQYQKDGRRDIDAAYGLVQALSQVATDDEFLPFFVFLKQYVISAYNSGEIADWDSIRSSRMMGSPANPGQVFESLRDRYPQKLVKQMTSLIQGSKVDQALAYGWMRSQASPELSLSPENEKVWRQYVVGLINNAPDVPSKMTALNVLNSAFEHSNDSLSVLIGQLGNDDLEIGDRTRVINMLIRSWPEAGGFTDALLNQYELNPDTLSSGVIQQLVNSKNPEIVDSCVRVMNEKDWGMVALKSRSKRSANKTAREQLMDDLRDCRFNESDKPKIVAALERQLVMFGVGDGDIDEDTREALNRITGEPVARIYGRLDQSQWIQKLVESKKLEEQILALEALSVLSARKEDPNGILDVVIKKMRQHDFSKKPDLETNLESDKVKIAAIDLVSSRSALKRYVRNSDGETKSVTDYNYRFVPLLINKLDDFEEVDALFVLRVLSKVSISFKRKDKNLVRAVSRFASRFFEAEDSALVSLALNEYVRVNQRPESWQSVVETLKRESVSDELRFSVLSALGYQADWDNQFAEIVDRLCQTDDPRSATTMIELGTVEHGSRVMQLSLRLLAENKDMLDEVHRPYPHWNYKISSQRSSDDYDTKLIDEIVGALDKLSNAQIRATIFRGFGGIFDSEAPKLKARKSEAEKAMVVLRLRAKDASAGQKRKMLRFVKTLSEITDKMK